MRRKAVSQRLRSVTEVRATLAVHRDRASDKLEAREQAPAASGELPFSYRAHFGLMESELVSVEEGLITAEDEHVRQQVRTAGLRRRVDELASELYQKQVAVRRILAGLYGADRGCELAAMAGRTPANPRLLAEQVDQTVQLLRNPEGRVPPRKIRGITVDFAVLADELHGVQVALQDARTDLERARKTADRTRALVNRAIAEYDSVVPWVVRNLEGLFRLVGERELADGIRGAVRRVTRRQGEAGQASPSFEAADVTSHAVRPGRSVVAQAFVSRIRRPGWTRRVEDAGRIPTRVGPALPQDFCERWCSQKPSRGRSDSERAPPRQSLCGSHKLP